MSATAPPSPPKKPSNSPASITPKYCSSIWRELLAEKQGADPAGRTSGFRALGFWNTDAGIRKANPLLKLFPPKVLLGRGELAEEIAADGGKLSRFLPGQGRTLFESSLQRLGFSNFFEAQQDDNVRGVPAAVEPNGGDVAVARAQGTSMFPAPRSLAGEVLEPGEGSNLLEIVAFVHELRLVSRECGGIRA